MTEQTQEILYAQLGAKIKDCRLKVGFNQSKLAEALDMSRASIINIEQGKQRPPLHLLYDISSILGVEVAELLPVNTKPQTTHYIEKLDDIWSTLFKSASDNSESKEKVSKFLQHISSYNSL